MIATADLNVWVETSTQAGMTTLTPYVRAVEDLDLHYDVQLLTNGVAGSSTVNQHGLLKIRAGEPYRLSSLTTQPSANGKCSLTVSVRSNDAVLKEQTFDCAKP